MLLLYYQTREKNMERKMFYLDHASTTPLSPAVYKKMLECYAKCQGNNTSVYAIGRQANYELEMARAKVAKAIGAEPNEIYFTSGGTEANNWAIKGIARANKARGNHIITSQIEHPSVLESCKELEREGFKVMFRLMKMVLLITLQSLKLLDLTQF